MNSCKKHSIYDDKEIAKKYEDIIIVAECGDGFEGMKKIAEHNPDLIFLDIQMLQGVSL